MSMSLSREVKFSNTWSTDHVELISSIQRDYIFVSADQLLFIPFLSLFKSVDLMIQQFFKGKDSWDQFVEKGEEDRLDGKLLPKTKGEIDSTRGEKIIQRMER